MDNKKQSQHMVDALFVLILFCFFAVCALMLITLGSNIYQNTVNHMNSNYLSRTSFAYVSEKIRQKDTQGSVSIQEFGDGPALVLAESIEDTTYETWIYTEQGYLKELFCKQGTSLEPSAGQNIMSCTAFSIEESSPQLYRICISTDNKNNFSCYVNTKSSSIED